MLLQVDKLADRVYFFNLIRNKNSFFIFNVKTIDERDYLYKYFSGNIVHSRKMFGFLYEKLSLDLFSGNIFFCFIDSSDFFNILLDLHFFKLLEGKLDLVGICYDNYFLNFNINYMNIYNCLYLNFIIIFFLISLFINLFFFKLFLLLKTILNVKKC